MGLLDDAIREHLDLMRRHGANEAEIARREAEALGPVLREDEAQGSESAAPAAAEGETSLPYDRAAEAGLTGESDLPSFEWQGSSTAEPEVPSFVSPEPVRDIEPEPDGGDTRADGDFVSAPTEAFDVVEAERTAGEGAAEEAELSVEPDPAAEEPEAPVDADLPKEQGTLREDPSAELSPEPPAIPEPLEEAAAPEPDEAALPDAEDSFGAPPPATPPPPQPGHAFHAAPGSDPDVSLQPPAEAALPEEASIEPTAPAEAEPELVEATPFEDETAFGQSPTEGDLAALPEADLSEAVPVVGTDAAEEPSAPSLDRESPDDEVTAFHTTGVGAPEPASGDLEELPPQPEPTQSEGGPLALGAEDLPPEQEPPPLPAGEVAEEPPVGLGLGEPPLEVAPEPPVEAPPPPLVEEPPVEEPFAAGEEEAWREAGEAPGDTPGARPEPPLADASSPEDLEPHPAQPLEADAVLEPGGEPPLDERPLWGPAPDAELPPPESLDASAGEPPELPPPESLDASPSEPLDPASGPPPPLPGDSEAARGFFDETAEHERRSSEDRAPTADPDFED